jgi:PAS domain-containing protein
VAALLGLLWAIGMRRVVARRTRELVDERQRLLTLVSTLPDLVWAEDLQGTYTFCNPAMARQLGRPERDIIGQRGVDLALPARAEADGGSYKSWDTAARLDRPGRRPARCRPRHERAARHRAAAAAIEPAGARC